MPQPEYTISCDEAGYVYDINGVDISESVFSEELVEYRIEDRLDLIEDILTLRHEMSESDRALVDEDVRMLSGLDDTYVLSSVFTNEYISPTENAKQFNQICKEIIDANQSVRKRIS